MESLFYRKDKRLQIYKIINKEQVEVPFKRNPAQVILEKRKCELREKYWRIRLIILKGRQMWISTNEAISWLDDAIMYSNQNIWILAQVDKTRAELFDKVKTAYTRLPEIIRLNDWKLRRKPTTKYSTKQELEFLDNHSKIAIITDSRWGTWSKLHISEFAFINNATELLAGTMPSVPKNSDIIIESTANGYGNEFEMMWNKYYGNDSYERSCIFLWRRIMPEYSLPVEDWEIIKLPKELEHLNKPMIDWTILSEWQKKWYLNMYNSYTNPDYAFQEYPSTPEEAFMNTGTSVFKTNVIKALKTPPYTEDDIIPDLRIYRPAPEGQVVYGWDTSAWISGGDYSCIMVRDRETAELLACYYWYTDPWDWLCKVVDRLINLWYRWRIGVEKNNTWYAFYTKAKEYDWYSLCYVNNTVDKTYDRQTQEIWWNTNAKTRPILMEDYKIAINQWLITECDERIIKEMHTFIYNEKMKEEAQIWYHDDWIMTDSICRQMRKYPLIEF